MPLPRFANLTRCAVLVLAGCASSHAPVSLAEPSPPPTAKQYVDELKRWTRHGELLHDFDAALEVDATLRSPEFRAAFADKYVKLYRIAPETAIQVRGELLADGADTYEFHLETATHDYALNELGGARSVWRITLVDDEGHEVTPTEILATRVKRELDLAMYPYANYFSRGWRIRFPRVRADGAPLIGADARSLTLRLSGPAGSIDLLWRLK
jgi:hypothetical protein